MRCRILLRSSSFRTFARSCSRPNPIRLRPRRFAMISSMWLNVPPQMNRMSARVHLEVLLLGVLAAALRGDVGDRPLHDLEQRLLHALARHVARDRGVLRRAVDLVDLVDVDDARLGARAVEVGGLEELEQDVLDVLADVAGLRERRGVRDREGHVEHAGERAGEERLAAAGRARRAGCCSCRARRPTSAPPARGGSGCRPRRRGSSSPGPGRRRTGRGTRGSRRGLFSSTCFGAAVAAEAAAPPIVPRPTSADAAPFAFTPRPPRFNSSRRIVLQSSTHSLQM